MNYSFVLEWEELPQELRNSKIDDYIIYNIDDFKEQHAESQDGYEEASEEEKEKMIEDVDAYDVVADEYLRMRSEEYIKSHFPIYF